MKNYKNFNNINETLNTSYSIDIISKDLGHQLDKKDFRISENNLVLYANIKNYTIISDIYSRITKLYNWYFVSCGYEMGEDEGLSREEEIENIYSLKELDYSEAEGLEISISFEPYFTEKDLDIPEKIYHYTSEKFINKINKQGLIPLNKGETEREYTPDRLYFYKTFSDAENGLYTRDKKIIIEILTKDLNIDFYKDINKNSIYTYDNIHPKYFGDIINLNKFDKDLANFNI